MSASAVSEARLLKLLATTGEDLFDTNDIKAMAREILESRASRQREEPNETCAETCAVTGPHGYRCSHASGHKGKHAFMVCWDTILDAKTWPHYYGPCSIKATDDGYTVYTPGGSQAFKIVDSTAIFGSGSIPVHQYPMRNKAVARFIEDYFMPRITTDVADRLLASLMRGESLYDALARVGLQVTP